MKVDTDKDGAARGKDLRVRVKIPVHEPLVRCFNLKKSKDDTVGTWFDFSYEKVPHFCFDCGRLVHVGGACIPPIDSSDQWGEWLRASPGRNNSGKEGSVGGAASNSNSFVSTQGGEGLRPKHESPPKMRDLQTKRNLTTDFVNAAESCTGGHSRQPRGEVNSPRKENQKKDVTRGTDLRQGLEQRREKDMRDKLMEQGQFRQGGDRRDEFSYRKGKDPYFAYEQERHADLRRGYKTEYGKPGGEPGMHGKHDMHGGLGRRRDYYVRKHREGAEVHHSRSAQEKDEHESKKRRPRQMWVAKGDGDRQGTHDALIRDTRRKTSSVFERISEQNDQAADPEQRGRRDQ